ncbi:MAG TPA: asparagine synthase, partial [Epsilonproteobacteria bacterium]|nr:asparagine synthase [Campylobacterota bacterium]
LKMNIKENRSLNAIQHYQQQFEASLRTAPVDWYTFLDLKVQLGEVFLRKLDRMSMAHSVEARTPFLDKEVVKAVFACDPQLRVEQLPKNWVREIAKKYLPDTIIHRKKKGFNYPYLQWLHESGELEVIQKVQHEKKLFQTEHLNWLLKESRQGKFQHQIFAIYLLCKWIDKKL